MRLYTCIVNNKTQLAASLNDRLTLLEDLGYSFASMNDLIETITDEELEEIKQKLNNSSYPSYGIDEVTLLAPIPHPRQDILCLGINYHAHAEESARFKKEAFEHDRKLPIYFAKRCNETVGHNGFIDAHRDLVTDLDYECELAVILRKAAKNVAKEDVYDTIFGYSIFNDVSARSVQTRHKQWYFGKSLDTFCCMGPCIVTKDEFSYPLDLSIQSFVNGELRQNSRTSLLIFDIDYIVNELSQGMTLMPATIIATGTPAGVGMGFVPPKFLNPGDTVTCKIEGLMELTNTVK